MKKILAIWNKNGYNYLKFKILCWNIADLLVLYWVTHILIIWHFVAVEWGSWSLETIKTKQACNMINCIQDKTRVYLIWKLIHTQFLFSWYYFLDVYNTRWVKSWGSTRLIDNINISNLTWYSDELVEPESGQNPTPQTKAKFDCLKLSNEESPWKIRMQFNPEDQQVYLKAELEVSWESWGSSYCWDLGWIGCHQMLHHVIVNNCLKMNENKNDKKTTCLQSQLLCWTWDGTSCRALWTSYWACCWICS